MLADAFGSFFFVFLLLVRLDQAWQGSLVAWLLSIQAAFTAYRIIIRKHPEKSSPWQTEMLAWLSAIVPLGMIVSSKTSSWLAIPGLLLSIWSLVMLGGSFSISPANRGLVRNGPYRLLRHPMYAGELLSLIGQCLANFILWNCLLLALFGLFLYIRIAKEESIIGEYDRYAQVVKWRLLPLVW